MNTLLRSVAISAFIIFSGTAACQVPFIGSSDDEEVASVTTEASPSPSPSPSSSPTVTQQASSATADSGTPPAQTTAENPATIVAVADLHAVEKPAEPSPSPSPSPWHEPERIVLHLEQSQIQASFTRPTHSLSVYGGHDPIARRLQFTHNAQKAECSHDGGATWSACDSAGSVLFTADDYANGRKIKVRLSNSDGTTSTETWDPLVEHPGLLFLPCTTTVTQDISKAEFDALQPTTAPTLASPHVICLRENVKVNSGGTTGITISQPNVFVVGTSVSKPTLSSLRLKATGAANQSWVVNANLNQAGAANPLYCAGTAAKVIINAEITSTSASAVLFSTDSYQAFTLAGSTVTSTGDNYYGIYIDANYPTMSIVNSTITQTGLWLEPLYFRGFQGTLSIAGSTISGLQGYKSAVKLHQNHRVTVTGSTMRGCYAAVDVNVGNTVNLADSTFKKGSEGACSTAYPAIRTVSPGNTLNDTSTGAGNLACNVDGTLKSFAAFTSGTAYAGSFDPAATRNHGNAASDIRNCAN